MRSWFIQAAAIVLFCRPAQAQNLNDASVIRPGDILVVTVYYFYPHEHGMVSQAFVKSDGKIAPPELRGIKPTEDLEIESLTPAEAAQRLRKSYLALMPYAQLGIGIRRGTLGKLLGE